MMLCKLLKLVAAQNAGDSIDLIQTSGKLMLEISPKCWSLQPNECELAALKMLLGKVDGERVLRIWKYFLLLFRATKHTNYAMEALTLLTQCLVALPENLAEQIKWSRFINIHGQLGRNIVVISTRTQSHHLTKYFSSPTTVGIKRPME